MTEHRRCCCGEHDCFSQWAEDVQVLISGFDVISNCDAAGMNTGFADELGNGCLVIPEYICNTTVEFPDINGIYTSFANPNRAVFNYPAFTNINYLYDLCLIQDGNGGFNQTSVRFKCLGCNPNLCMDNVPLNSSYYTWAIQINLEIGGIPASCPITDGAILTKTYLYIKEVSNNTPYIGTFTGPYFMSGPPDQGAGCDTNNITYGMDGLDCITLPNSIVVSPI